MTTSSTLQLDVKQHGEDAMKQDPPFTVDEFLFDPHNLSPWKFPEPNVTYEGVIYTPPAAARWWLALPGHITESVRT